MLLRGFLFFTSLRGFAEAVAIFHYEMIYEKVCDHHNDADDGSVSVLQGFVGGDVLECGEFLRLCRWGDRGVGRGVLFHGVASLDKEEVPGKV